MAGRWARAWPLLLGVVAPLALLVTNAVWAYAGILLTIAAILWLGFALVVLGDAA